MVQMEGVWNGSKTTADRVVGEGESGLGGDSLRPDHERIGIPIRRASDADRTLETAAVGRRRQFVFARSSPAGRRPGGVDRRPVRTDRPLADGAGLAEKKTCPPRLSSSGVASSLVVPA
jgi:hypothetical protein